MSMKNFLKPSKYKIFAFILLLYFFLKGYFLKGFYKFDIKFIWVWYPLFLIVMSYIMGCSAGEFINRMIDIKKKENQDKIKEIGVFGVIITKWHFCVITLVVIIPQLIIFGKAFGFEISVLTLIEIIIIYFIYWLIYRPKVKKGEGDSP